MFQKEFRLRIANKFRGNPAPPIIDLSLNKNVNKYQGKNANQFQSKIAVKYLDKYQEKFLNKIVDKFRNNFVKVYLNKFQHKNVPRYMWIDDDHQCLKTLRKIQNSIHFLLQIPYKDECQIIPKQVPNQKCIQVPKQQCSTVPVKVPRTVYKSSHQPLCGRGKYG